MVEAVVGSERAKRPASTGTVMRVASCQAEASLSTCASPSWPIRTAFSRKIVLAKAL